MPDYDFDLGVIGGGAAGLTVTAGASRLGVKTLLVEKEKALGGDCLHYGCVPRKALIKTARVYHLLRKTRVYGLPEASIGEVDFRDIALRIQSVIETIQKHDSPERFCRLGAGVEFGDPVFVDEHSIRLNGNIHSAKKWVIATGSSPSYPPFEGLTETPFITNKEIFSLNHLPSSMIVLGAGPVAIEMAQAFCRLGTRVSVIQRSGQILSREDRDMAETVMDALSKEGVNFYLNSKVLRVKDLGNERMVVITQGDNELKLRAETVLVAMGRKANLDGLGLGDIGVEFDKKGLKLDERLRTTQRHIYAAGDVTGRFLFTHAAGYEGGVVISNAVFHLPRKVNYTLMPWCTYTDPELASIGMNEKAAAEAGIEYTIWTEDFRDNDRALAEGESTGKIKMILNKKGSPVGVQILGLHAGELLGEWVASLNAKVKLSTLAASVHSYPTLSEINKRVAGDVLSTKLFSDKVRKGLKLFFNFKGRACKGEGNRQDHP